MIEITRKPSQQTLNVSKTFTSVSFRRQFQLKWIQICEKFRWKPLPPLFFHTCCHVMFSSYRWCRETSMTYAESPKFLNRIHSFWFSQLFDSNKVWKKIFDRFFDVSVPRDADFEEIDWKMSCANLLQQSPDDFDLHQKFCISSKCCFKSGAQSEQAGIFR